ncbi:MAG: hypothetical protein HGA44_18440 [Cellulomonadaceae bacterium]|nr:hypothetical protein [Cellulomonadaceae bacterium]
MAESITTEAELDTALDELRVALDMHADEYGGPDAEALDAVVTALGRDRRAEGAPAETGAQGMLDYTRMLVTSGEWEPDAVIARLREMFEQGLIEDGEPTGLPRPFADLRTTGLLWLINRTVFHPRGYALGLAMTADGVALGWTLLGDGTDPWEFTDSEIEHFRAAERTLAQP